MKISQASAPQPSGVVVFADGTTLYGEGAGAVGDAVGEICFNTAMTGYQEILSDPSYAEQIVTFTFPHIGNVGVNQEDVENASTSSAIAARGAIFRAKITSPSNYRAQLDFNDWLRRRGIIALSGVDTRALTARIREEGMMNASIAHNPAGEFDIEALAEKAKSWRGLEMADLASVVTDKNGYAHSESEWEWSKGYGASTETGPHIVVVDFGVKRNILRRLANADCRVSVVSASTSAEEILSRKPDGVVLSNGPGDPAATAEYAAPMIRTLIEKKIPLFGICLGHQLLALASGAKTMKMTQGHHGANHPVKDLSTGKVEIVSMNHGFAVDPESLPTGVRQTHVSLFDGSNCGIALEDAPAMSVQYHPEASPGPEDSFYIFDRFIDTLAAA